MIKSSNSNAKRMDELVFKVLAKEKYIQGREDLGLIGVSENGGTLDGEGKL